MAYASFLPWIHKHCRVRERDPDALQPEARLYWLLYGTYLPWSPRNSDSLSQWHPVSCFMTASNLNKSHDNALHAA